MRHVRFVEYKEWQLISFAVEFDICGEIAQQFAPFDFVFHGFAGQCVPQSLPFYRVAIPLVVGHRRQVGFAHLLPKDFADEGMPTVRVDRHPHWPIIYCQLNTLRLSGMGFSLFIWLGGH